MAREVKECCACFEVIDVRATICPRCRTCQPTVRAAKRVHSATPWLKVSMAGLLGLILFSMAAGLLEVEGTRSRSVTRRAPTTISREELEQQAERRAQAVNRAAVIRAHEEERRQDEERQEAESARAKAEAEATHHCQGSAVAAYVMTQDVVRGQLKSPSSAEFPTIGWGDGRGVRSTPIGDCVYRIEAFVDSQNGFGAMLRARYTAEIEATDGGAWRIRSLEFPP